MDKFIKVAALSELIESKGIVRKLGDDEIALVKLDGHISAFINVCPHQHTPLVDKSGGQIAGENLTCPMHGWTYDLRTGKSVDVPSYSHNEAGFQDINISERDISHTANMITSGKSGKLKMLGVKIESGCVFVRKVPGDFPW
ncbi:MAG TPA: Rieske (2Fe-2S) protein [Candidatus Acidoferrales bacterium]|nr:Rieske (2Fe-2S) protein [Candidatus Acidoferrales bacterium]